MTNTWQIAHDFLATLIERVLDGVRGTAWRTVRPWLTLAAVAVSFGVGLLWPREEKQLALGTLNLAGFLWDERNKSVTAVSEIVLSLPDLHSVSHALHVLKPRQIILSGAPNVLNVDALKGLTDLRLLDLTGDHRLQSVD
jgi:hypothetical protein